MSPFTSKEHPAPASGGELSALTPIEPAWLARARGELEETGWAVEIYDSSWRLRWVSPELRSVLGAEDGTDLGVGEHLLEVYQLPLWRQRITPQSRWQVFESLLPYILPLDDRAHAEMLKRLDRPLVEMVGKIEPQRAPSLWSVALDFLPADNEPLGVQCLNVKLRDENDDHVGYARIYGPRMRASLLSLVARGDEEMFERMRRLVEPGRHPVAILFADLEGSTALSRRLPSSVYFRLISTMAHEFDRIIIRHDGVVGKHVGDGASAFFVADDHGEPSAAARAAIVSASQISAALDAIADEIGSATGIGDLALKINIGLHWGSTVYMGQIVSDGRLEVSALGDEVNECARMQEAAHSGTTLASKGLIERLSTADASDLGIALGATTYTPLGDYPNASQRIARDAGSIPVVELHLDRSL